MVKRFIGSLRPGPPPPEDENWAKGNLLPGELEVWEQMSNPDRRHAVGVARLVCGELGSAVERPVVAAALLHDSGKVVSNLRTPARVVATVIWTVLSDERAGEWSASRWPLNRLGQYRLHPELGAQLLVEAQSAQLTIDWTRQHHQPASSWTLPADIARVLKECDDD